jgi:isopentenyl-diphosphate delta-isomerase
MLLQNAVTSVSFDDEPLILVDSDDQEVGHMNKASAHTGDGRLHRAFSIFLFNGPDRVYLHRRSTIKPLWPAFWTNSCCSHPRRGESYQQATQRRLYEELGVNTPLEQLYRFEYHATYKDVGSEHELCWVYVGNHSDQTPIKTHPEEIMADGWFACDEVDEWTAKHPEDFTPWFLMEWPLLRGRYRMRIQEILSRSQPAAR